MPAPSVISSSSASASLSTSVGVTAPTSISSGNLLQALCVGGMGLPTPPAGWSTALVEWFVGGPFAVIYEKVATGSEPPSYTFNAASGSDTLAVAILNLSGAGTPPDDKSQNGGGPGTTASAGSVTAAGGTDLLVALFAGLGPTSITPQGSMTSQQAISGGVSLCAATEALSGSGASGSRTATLGSSVTWSALMIAVPASGGAVVQPAPPCVVAYIEPHPCVWLE